MSAITLPISGRLGYDLRSGFHQSAGTPAWSPPGSPILWFDPSHPASLFADTSGTTPAVDDGGVARINNRGSSVIYLQSATESQRPAWDETAGLYSLLFDGSADRLISNANLDLTALNVLTLVFARRRTSDAALGIVCNHNATTGPYFQFRSPSGAGTNDVALTRRNTSDGASQIVITGQGATNTAVYTWELNFSGSTVNGLAANTQRYRRNRASWNSLAIAGTTGTFANALFSLGSTTAGASTFPGSIYQLFLLSGIPSDDDRIIYEDHCAELSGVTL